MSNPQTGTTGLSAGDWTRLKRIMGFRPMTSVMDRIDASVPGNAPPLNSSNANSFVLACIDPRFASALTEYLDQELYEPGYYTYDLFILAGAALGGNQVTGSCAVLSSSSNWQRTLLDHIQVAILLHNVKSFIIIDHLDCGAYKVCANAGNDTDPTLHQLQYINLINTIKSNTFISNSGTSDSGNAIFTGGFSGYYFSVPVDGLTRLINYTSGPTKYIEPFPDSSTAKVLVLGCIDPRFISTLTSFLVNFKEVRFIYDLFILAGSSLGANQSYTTVFPTLRTNTQQGTAPYPNNLIPNLGITWGPSFFDHISIARLLHQITEVWIFDHLDCGAYKRIKYGNANAPDNDSQSHTNEIVKLAENINTYTSTTDYLSNSPTVLSKKGFVMDTDGVITTVYDDGTGVKFGLGKQLGSSNIRKPASDYTGSVLYNTMDFVQQVSTPQGAKALTVTRVCSCTTVYLYPRVTNCSNCEKH
jgi:carbonic anhydrase